MIEYRTQLTVGDSMMFGQDLLRRPNDLTKLMQRDHFLEREMTINFYKLSYLSYFVHKILFYLFYPSNEDGGGKREGK